jgi:hypothetical protein
MRATMLNFCWHCRRVTSWRCDNFRPRGDPWTCGICGRDPLGPADGQLDGWLFMLFLLAAFIGILLLVSPVPIR